MLRIALAAVLLVPSAMAEEVYPCDTATGDDGTTYAYCPYSGACYEVSGGTLSGISTLDKDECLDQANGAVDDGHTTVDETRDADRSLWAEVYVGDELTDETLIEEAEPVRTYESLRF